MSRRDVVLVGGPCNGQRVRLDELFIIDGQPLHVRPRRPDREKDDVALYLPERGRPYFLWAGALDTQPRTFAVTRPLPLDEGTAIRAVAEAISRCHASVIAAGFVPLPPECSISQPEYASPRAEVCVRMRAAKA